jgi:hypothetical protein
MVQIRVMTDDRERGERVVEDLLALLQACAALEAGEPTRLTHRGGGLRLVLDVEPATTLEVPPTCARAALTASERTGQQETTTAADVQRGR